MGGSNSKEVSRLTKSFPSSKPWRRKHSQSDPKELEQLLAIEPNELRFPFETRKQILCSMQLTNITDDYIAFKVKTTNPKVYCVRPNSGILPPRLACNMIVTMQAQREAPPHMQCMDRFLVQSVVVREGRTIKEITRDMFEKDAVAEVKLKVVYVQPPRPPSPVREGSQAGSPPRPSWLHGGNINHQDTVSTLYSVLLQHLKDITNNFCDERILGTGGFGVVYKGVLGDGTVIAVKKFVQSMLSSQEQFENEYLPRGSLDKYISDASSGLDWPTRFRIIEGVSYGLQYLHEQSDGPIIHLDLKPGNVLLDENMIPKITDFGLSRLFDKKQTIHTVITRGTLGYMPPEYLRGIITPMSDIFSLGVLILEVITGHRDYPDDIRTFSTDFIELELQRWRNVLQKEHVYTSLETDCQRIKICIQIGLICVNPDRTKRPTMKKIIDMLQGLECMDWYITNAS